MIDDKSLPYFDEMKKIVVASFGTTHTSLSDDGRRDAVFYTFAAKFKEDIDTIFGKKERKLIIASTVLCAVAFSLIKRKKH